MRRYTKKQLEFIDKLICAPLRDMTERNAHTEAVVFLAKQLEARKEMHESPSECETLLKWARFIQDEHNRIGYLPYALIMFRTYILEVIERNLFALFDSPKVEKMIHESL